MLRGILPCLKSGQFDADFCISYFSPALCILSYSETIFVSPFFFSFPQMYVFLCAQILGFEVDAINSVQFSNHTGIISFMHSTILDYSSFIGII